MKVMVSLVEAKAEAMEMEAVMVAWVKQPGEWEQATDESLCRLTFESGNGESTSFTGRRFLRMQNAKGGCISTPGI